MPSIAELMEMMERAEEIREAHTITAAYYFIIGYLEQCKPKVFDYIDSNEKKKPKKRQTVNRNQIINILRSQKAPLTLKEVVSLLDIEYNVRLTTKQIYAKMKELIDEEIVIKSDKKKSNQDTYLITKEQSGKIGIIKDYR